MTPGGHAATARQVSATTGIPPVEKRAFASESVALMQLVERQIEDAQRLVELMRDDGKT
jgi:hypothetical protein